MVAERMGRREGICLSERLIKEVVNITTNVTEVTTKKEKQDYYIFSLVQFVL